MTLLSPSILGAAYGMSELCLTLTRRSRSGSVSKDRGSLALLWTVIPASVWLGFFLAFALPGWTLPHANRFYILGLGFFTLGLFLRWFSIIYLGRFFTVNVAVASDHQLIDSGPYRFIRHPSYAGALLAFLGLGLCLGNLASLLILIVPILFAYLWRIRVEEKALIEALGERYHSYVRKTKRLIPFVF
jgi:protein-S-isoprenylcysteine O-methyltransferase